MMTAASSCWCRGLVSCNRLTRVIILSVQTNI